MAVDYGTLNTTLGTLLERINTAGVAVDGTLQPVFFVVGVLMLVFACVKFMWQKDLAPLAGFVIQFIMLMGIITLSSRWMDITGAYVTGMGGYGGRIGGFVLDQMSPASVIIRGLTLASKMYTENISWMRTIFGTTEDSIANIIMMLVCVGTIAVSVLMAVFLMLIFVVMKLASVVALVFLIFLVFDWSRFAAAPGVARIMAYGVQMLVMSIVAGLMFASLDALQLSDRMTADEAITTFAIVTFFTFLFLSTTAIAREQISGMPALSLNEFGNGLGRGAMAAASMLPAGIGLAGRMIGSAGHMPSWKGISMGSRGGPSGGAGSFGGMPAGGGGGAMPGTAQRMLGKSTIIDATWTDAKDLAPKAAQRMLTQSQKALPAAPRALPPSRFS